MGTRKKSLLLITAVLAILSVLNTRLAFAHPQRQTTTPSELIDAVNSLRLSHGLPALSVHSVLMQVAQIEADGIANGAGGHWRPSGLTLGQWLISLGYPLSGDLSLDGYRSENWVAAQTADQAVQAWLGDQPHTDTMLSTYRSDIGAGVGVAADGQTFLVIETALRTSSGVQQSQAVTMLTSLPQNKTSNGTPNSFADYINPVVLSTARPDGDVFHKVQYGQSLWSIAIDYGTTIKSIQKLNNLGDNLVVYDGQNLLVLKGATPPPPSTPTPVPSPTRISTLTALTAVPQIVFPFTAVAASTQTKAIEDNPANAGSSSRFLVIVLIVVSFVGGGLAVWLIRDPKV